MILNAGKCPVCAQPTGGKQVCQVNFCPECRLIAIEVRDAWIEKNKGKPTPKGEDFARMVIAKKKVGITLEPHQLKTFFAANIKEKINEVLSAVKQGSLLMVTFNEAGAMELQYLVGMLNNGFLKTTGEWDEIGIHAVAMSKQWYQVSRTFIFEIVVWDDNKRDWFTQRLARAIEDIDLA